MPIMTRMRDSMPTILFGLLIAFLITIIFEWGMDYTGMNARGSNVIGSVNGKDVSYTEFTDILRQFTENQRARTGSELTDTQLKQARDQVWDAIVSRSLVSEEIKRLGITVPDEEIIAWVQGDNPPEDLRQSFVDSSGVFRKDLYEQFLSDPNQFVTDPQGLDQRFGTKWLANYEQTLRERRSQEKLRSLLNAMVFVSEGEVRQTFEDENLKYEFEYALLDANRLIPDSTIEVTEKDIRGFYDGHLDQQRVDARRLVKYVHFRETPSEADSEDVNALMENLAERARGGENFIDLVYTYDEKPDSGAFFNHGEMNPILEEAVFAAPVDAVVGPVLANDGYHLMRVLADRPSAQEFIRARHILFAVQPGDDTLKVLAEARDVASRLRQGADFSELAKEYSKDPGSGQNGGELGWFGRNRMVKPFEAAAFNAKIGQIVGPVRTQFGWHIIRVDDRQSRSVKVADIHIRVLPTSQTVNQIFDRATDFAYNARQTDFIREAQSMGMEAKDAELTEKGTTIPGLGVSEAAVQWAFRHGVDDVSEPFDVADGFAVFAVTETKAAGVRPFEEVKENLRGQTLRSLKIRKTMEMAAEMREHMSPGDSVSKVLTMEPEATLKRVGPLTLTSTIPGVGRDPGFVGTVTSLGIGEISGPVEGLRGGYLVQLISKERFDSLSYAAQRPAIRNRLLKDKKTRYYNDWLAMLKESADIEDNRALFYR